MLEVYIFMEKTRPFTSGVLIIALVFGMTVVGCATTQHDVEITNVRNIREINIRNAGAAHWGPNFARHLQNIDISMFSETVDIRVVDTDGIVFSRYNVPFGDAAFQMVSRTSTINYLLLSILILTGGIAFAVFVGGN